MGKIKNWLTLKRKGIKTKGHEKVMPRIKKEISKTMDITQEFNDTENALRDFIQSRMRAEYHDEWIKHLGVTENRISKWKERRRTKTSSCRNTRGETSVLL
ncbi:MAG: hypothetical protein L6408_09190 [Nanoarchaeota archaeon]|nr:hypothetical protein [Nanoarchaeota archaeon]